MRTSFPLFQSHLDLAHHYWQRLVRPGDSVIDATCGNGFDTLVLAQLALTPDSGSLYGFDIQEQAIESTAARLQTTLDPKIFGRVHLYQQSHCEFPADIIVGTVKLIVYNLGYLPGGDKSVTTRVDSTLASLEKALILLESGGCLSLTAYPGHQEGERERDAILEMISALDPMQWSSCQHTWLNRNASPTLILIQRRCLSS